jgi:hemolysin activation/secretion protein
MPRTPHPAQRIRALLTAVLPACAILAAALPAEALPRDWLRRSYRVSAFELEYALPHPGEPPAQELLAREVAFSLVEGGYGSPHPAWPEARFPLGEIPGGRGVFWASGLQHVARELVAELGRRGLSGVVVSLPEIDEPTGRDLRRPDDERLRVRIWLGRASDVVTLADGERFEGLSAEERTNHPAHARIREGSPVQPGGERDLLRVGELEDYAAWRSRHPTRRVDVELAPGPATGTSVVTLRVAEAKSWRAYAQYGNLGTQETTRNRERLGFAHHQLSGRDDILRLDYATGDFDEVNALYGSYELPVPGLERLRVETAGGWSQYTASEVGFPEAAFAGNGWTAGLRVTGQVFQHRELFVDLSAGTRWEYAHVDNRLFGEETRQDFFLPSVGLAVERQTLTSALYLTSETLFNAAGIAGTDDSPELDLLGRADADAEFTLTRWDARLAAYLEPLLAPEEWADPSTPMDSTLAHELELALRGQYAYQKRLPPQFEAVVGGLFTVRGYPQSAIARDDACLATLEYRLHVPRLLAPGREEWVVPMVGRFRPRAQRVYGLPDWDLILRAFFDFAWVHSNAAGPTKSELEFSEALKSAGFGVELQVLQHLSARVDVGFPLDPARDLTDAYDPRAHLLVTVLY